MYIWKTEILFQARVLLGNSNSWGPASVKNSDKALAGTSMFFNVDEVEVFYLDPSN